MKRTLELEDSIVVFMIGYLCGHDDLVITFRYISQIFMFLIKFYENTTWDHFLPPCSSIIVCCQCMTRLSNICPLKN